MAQKGLCLLIRSKNRRPYTGGQNARIGNLPFIAVPTTVLPPFFARKSRGKPCGKYDLAYISMYKFTMCASFFSKRRVVLS